MCMFVCVLPPSNPTTSSPLSLSPSPLKCHAVLSTRLTFYPPQQAFCVARRRGTETGRERPEEGAGGCGGWRESSCCWLVVSDLWEHLLNIRRAGVLPKMLHFSLLSPVLSALLTTTVTPPWFQTTIMTCAVSFFLSHSYLFICWLFSNLNFFPNLLLDLLPFFSSHFSYTLLSVQVGSQHCILVYRGNAWTEKGVLAKRDFPQFLILMAKHGDLENVGQGEKCNARNALTRLIHMFEIIEVKHDPISDRHQQMLQWRCTPIKYM